VEVELEEEIFESMEARPPPPAFRSIDVMHCLSSKHRIPA
jgi:hypothetical protein